MFSGFDHFFSEHVLVNTEYEGPFFEKGPILGRENFLKRDIFQ